MEFLSEVFILIQEGLLKSSAELFLKSSNSLLFHHPGNHKVPDNSRELDSYLVNSIVGLR